MASFSLVVTPEQFAALGKEAAQIGISPTATEGILPAYDGVKLSYAVHGPVIEFTVVAKPFYVSVGVIQDHVKKLIGIS